MLSMEALPRPLLDVLRTARVKQFPKGQIILYEGDAFSDVFIIKKGAIKLYDIDEQGNEKVLHIVANPAVIPYAFFSGNQASTRWYYTALTDCEVYVVEQDKLRELMNSDSRVAWALIGNFSQDVHELLLRLSSLGKSVAQDKLLVALRFLTVRHARERLGGWWRVRFAVNHQLLADMVGITRESTAVAMKDLQEKGITRNPRQTTLEINRDKLLATTIPSKAD
jgi:CRP/FNR family cyclic AMP-dependent transcriptional regulator